MADDKPTFNRPPVFAGNLQALTFPSCRQFSVRCVNNNIVPYECGKITDAVARNELAAMRPVRAWRRPLRTPRPNEEAYGYYLFQMDRLVGRGFGKAFRLGGQAVKVDFNACYNAIRPKAGNETWLLGVKPSFQLPN